MYLVTVSEQQKLKLGYPHDIKGQGIYAYVICNKPPANMDDFLKEINAVVIEIIGPIAKPDKVQVVSGLPKTRSGKIMRRILRKVAEGDVSNLFSLSHVCTATRYYRFCSLGRRKFTCKRTYS